MTTSFRTLAAGTFGALALIVTLTSPPSLAQQGGRGSMAACRTDMATFCPGLEAGGGKRMQCLQANETKLQPACADAVRERMANRGAGKAGGKTGEQAAAGGPPPLAATPAQPGQQAAGLKPMQICKSDVQALCGTIARGGGARMKCLRENQTKVSPACAEALAAKQDDRKNMRAATRAVCKADVQTLCAGQKGPERRACLTANVDKLSPSCAAVIKPI